MQCAACSDDFPLAGTVKAQCEHSYCADCVVNLFTAAMTDEGLMPPRCCRLPIPLRAVASLLGPEATRQFEYKVLEFGTPNRLYCPVESCSAFIGSASTLVGTVQVCPRCSTRVCAYCKTLEHSSWILCSDDRDPVSKLVLELGQKEGWRRCNRCRRLVELAFGWWVTLLCSAYFSGRLMYLTLIVTI